MMVVGLLLGLLTIWLVWPTHVFVAALVATVATTLWTFGWRLPGAAVMAVALTVASGLAVTS